MTEKKPIRKKAETSSNLKNICWIALLLLAIAGMVYGWVGREEWDIVLEKARNICFQCIGLG